MAAAVGIEMSVGENGTRKRWTPLFIIAGLLVVIGLALLIGGIWLLMLGGSWYYLLSGLFVTASGALLWRGNAWGERLYVLMLLGTVLWSLWEVGFDAWGLMPRLLAPTVFGLVLLVPFIRRGLNDRRALLGRRPAAAAALSALAIIALAFAWKSLSSPVAALSFAAAHNDFAADSDWPHYGNTLRGTRFSPLSQVSPQNVSQLEVAWIHRSGKIPDAGRSGVSSYQATPLKIKDTLYTCTPRSVVIALDAQTGAERWRYDPLIRPLPYYSQTCRGVSYYRTHESIGVCAERIIAATMDARLLALDAQTGQPCRSFGNNGVVSLLEGLGQVTPGNLYPTSPATIVKDHVILGMAYPINQSIDAPSGVVRAFDPITGVLRWAWDIGAPERIGAPPLGETYTRSTPNAWPVYAADEELGLVYIPTSNPYPDYYGAKRKAFDEQYGSAIVALDVQSGRPRWSFQTVHHDLWDYDVPAQPVLVDLGSGDHVTPAVVQATKQGDIYVFDRRTGEPIVPVTERAVPQGAAPGDWVSKTQPFSALTLAPPVLTEASMWGLTPIDQMICRIRFRQSRYEGPFTPIGAEKYTIMFPGLAGMVSWGSLSVHDHEKIIVANSTAFPFRLRLVPHEEVTPEAAASLAGSWMPGTPYAVEVSPFLGPLQVPCNQPPWGMLTAIDLKTQQVLWKRVLGTGRDTGPFGIPSMLPIPMGVPNTGGTLTTRSGLVFISGTLDRYLRAFDLRAGKELWKARLPAGGQATPMTYMAGGRQFVVVTAGGYSFLGTKLGDYTIAYALPAQ